MSESWREAWGSSTSDRTGPECREMVGGPCEQLNHSSLPTARPGWRSPNAPSPPVLTTRAVPTPGPPRFRNKNTETLARLLQCDAAGLRRKLGDDARHPRYILSDGGLGYRMTWSMCDWKIGLVERQVQLQREAILALEERMDDVQSLGL